MRKISAMYEWSGGTDYRHLCKECPNCIPVVINKRTVYKCMSYGNTACQATDWNPAHIACKAFGKTPPQIPVYKLKPKSASGSRQDEQIEGQMSIEDLSGNKEGKWEG